MNLTTATVAILLFIVPAFFFREAHFTTRYYRLARLKRTERFLPFFVHDWQFVLIYALAISLALHYSYWLLLYCALGADRDQITQLVTPFLRDHSTSKYLQHHLLELYASIAVGVPLYIGLVFFSWLAGFLSGFVRWNFIEFRFQSVPNPWFYLIRPVGDDKATVIDVLSKIEGPNGFPLMYRGIAAGITMGRDGSPTAIAMMHAYRASVKTDSKAPSDADFLFIRIPGELFVVRFDDIRNINVASVVRVDLPLTRTLRIRNYIRGWIDSFWTAD